VLLSRLSQSAGLPAGFLCVLQSLLVASRRNRARRILARLAWLRFVGGRVGLGASASRRRTRSATYFWTLRLPRVLLRLYPATRLGRAGTSWPGDVRPHRGTGLGGNFGGGPPLGRAAAVRLLVPPPAALSYTEPWAPRRPWPSWGCFSAPARRRCWCIGLAPRAWAGPTGDVGCFAGIAVIKRRMQSGTRCAFCFLRPGPQARNIPTFWEIIGAPSRTANWQGKGPPG